MMQKSPRSKISILVGFAISLMFLQAGCAATSTTENSHSPIADSSTHQPGVPENSRSTESGEVFVDELEIITDNSGRYLRIEGSLPTPCHHLSPPERKWESDTLSVSLTSWHDTEMMCAQVLEPFVYYYDLEDDNGDNAALIRCNGVSITP